MDAVLKVVPVTPEPDVLGRVESTSDVPGSQAQPADAGKTETEEEDPTLLDDSVPEDAALKTKKKVRALLKQRRELTAQLQQLEPDANVGATLSNFARENDLAPDDVVLGMSAMAALRRGDYENFYRTVAPYVRRAQEVLGLVLPEDLGRHVQSGQLPEAAARELAALRFRQQQAEVQAQTVTTRADQERVAYVQNDVQRAVSALEDRYASGDPDYRAKAEPVRRAAQALLFERGGKINSVQEALDIVQRAYNEVTQQFRRFAPQVRPTSPLPNGNTQQPLARSAPKSMMEAALLGLENARRHG